MTARALAFGPPSAGCRLAVSLPEGRLLAGRGLELTLVFRNEGPSDAELSRSWLWTEYQLKVEDAAGRAVPATRFARQVASGGRGAGVQGFLKVRPGEDVADTLLLNRLFDLSVAETYTVEASRSARVLPARERVTVVSGRIVFELGEA